MGRNYKWTVLALLGCAYFFHQADRAIFGVLTPFIQSDLGLTTPEIGRINTVLSWTIAAVTFFAGFIGDRFSRKWIITFSLMFWSLATMAMGYAGEMRLLGLAVPAYTVVLMLRSFATGGGESFYGPASMSLIAAYHEKTRSLAFSINQGALYLGLMLSGFLALKVFGLLGGWRQVFIAFGAAGLLLGIFFIWALKDVSRPTTHEPRTANREPRTANRAITHSLAAFFLNPSALLATAGFVAIVCVNNAYLFWAPKIFAERFFAGNVEEAAVKVGAHVMFYHHLVAFGAILFGGWLTDRFVGRFPRFRLGLQIVALLAGAVALFGIGRGGTFAAAVMMTAVYGLFRGLFEVNTHASVFDVVPADCRASVVGFMLLLAFFIGGWFSGDFMGRILADASAAEGCARAFAIMAGVYVAGAVCLSVSFFFTFRRDRKRPASSPGVQ